MKPKVLLLQGTISSYRIPVYNIIAQNMDLTVAYTVKNECKVKALFNVVKLDSKKIGGLFFIKDSFRKMCAQYDVVIFLADLHYFSFCLLPFISRNYKVIPWTIGVRASYTLRYDVTRKKNFIDRVYGLILKKSDAIIFYMKESIKFWNGSLDENKIFIAHNTVEVLKGKMVGNVKKESILFVGTLYKEKKIYELIEAFIEAKSNCIKPNFLKLEIIGKGEEFDNIKRLIKSFDLTESIILHGAIYDEKILATFFSKSIVCVSPDQAGLSVVKSMGYGVPYVTRANAITGGERFNIIDNYNGLFYNAKEELVDIIEDVYENPTKYISMGENAYDYYHDNCTPDLMAQGVIDAVEFTLN